MGMKLVLGMILLGFGLAFLSPRVVCAQDLGDEAPFGEAAPSVGETTPAEVPTSEAPAEVPKVTVDFSLESLPQVRVTPVSPFYFLKLLWENVLRLATRDPEAKAALDIKLANQRLAEALAVAKERNFGAVERLFKARTGLITEAVELLSGIVGGSTRSEDLRTKISAQLALGEAVLADIIGMSVEGDGSRVENLRAWQSSWIAELEAGLGPKSELMEATEAAALNEGSASARSQPRVVSLDPIVDFFEALFNTGSDLLSPLAVPEK